MRPFHFPCRSLGFTLLALGYIALICLVALSPSAVLAESFEPVDPEQRIATLVPEIETLFVLPEYEQEALEALGAEAIEDGWYAFETVVSQLVPSGLGVLETQATLLFQVVFADGFEPDDYEVLAGYWGYDPNGELYHIYYDAACVAVDDDVSWQLGDCDTTSPLPSYAQSHRSYRGPHGRCKKWAESTCVERIEVVEIGFFYLDDRCNLLAGAVPSLQFSCRVP